MATPKKKATAKSKAKSARVLEKENITRARRAKKIPASESRKRSLAMKKALTKAERKKILKEAWKTRRKFYGKKGYKNKPGSK
jgi:hypothetical protein